MSAEVTYETNHTSNALIFVFYVFYCDLKEKYHIGGNINCKKKEKFACEISIIIPLNW